MQRRRSLALLTIMAAALLGTAHAQPPQVSVGNAWARATPPSASTGAIYLTLASPAGDRLTGVSSSAAATAQVHEMSMDGAIMRMRELPDGLALPPGQTITLQPGGYHIMLIGLKAPLKQGDTVVLHLTFAKSAPMDVTAQIAGLGASAPVSQPGATSPGGTNPL